MWQSIVFVIAGIALVLVFAGRLVRGTVGFARGFGVSAFVVSVVFLGFDPENLAVGAVGAYEGAEGIALGTIVGSAMVAIALAFGITARALRALSGGARSRAGHADRTKDNV